MINLIKNTLIFTFKWIAYVTLCCMAGSLTIWSDTDLGIKNIIKSMKGDI